MPQSVLQMKTHTYDFNKLYVDYRGDFNLLWVRPMGN
jgi:hypothetical protein